MRTTRATLVASLAAAATLAMTACSQMPEGAKRMMGMQERPAPEAKALWAHLQAADYRKRYALFPGKPAMYQAEPPHGAWLSTFVNDSARKALESGAKTMPAGAIIVKENYTPAKVLDAVTVMYKSPGFDPANNDWYWLKRGADGQVQAEGKVAGCIGCHRPSPRDYVRTPVAMR